MVKRRMKGGSEDKSKRLLEQLKYYRDQMEDLQKQGLNDATEISKCGADLEDCNRDKEKCEKKLKGVSQGCYAPDSLGGVSAISDATWAKCQRVVRMQKEIKDKKEKQDKDEQKALQARIDRLKKAGASKKKNIVPYANEIEEAAYFLSLNNNSKKNKTTKKKTVKTKRNKRSQTKKTKKNRRTKRTKKSRRTKRNTRKTRKRQRGGV